MAACIGCVVSTWIWILCAIWILLLLTACAKKIVTGMKAEKERACERERERDGENEVSVTSRSIATLKCIVNIQYQNI